MRNEKTTRIEEDHNIHVIAYGDLLYRFIGDETVEILLPSQTRDFLIYTVHVADQPDPDAWREAMELGHGRIRPGQHYRNSAQTACNWVRSQLEEQDIPELIPYM